MQFHLMMVRLETFLIAIVVVLVGTSVSEGKLIRQIRQTDCLDSVKADGFNDSNPEC